MHDRSDPVTSISHFRDVYNSVKTLEFLISPDPRMFDFAAWPPELSREQLEKLTLYAATYSLCNGNIHLPPAGRQPVIPTTAIYAPFALFPSPFPRRLFEKARKLQRSYNILYSRIAMDVEFLDRVMCAEGLEEADGFIGQLWRRWMQLREAGLAQVASLQIFVDVC